MSSRRNKPSPKQNFLKRRSFLEGRALVDAAHLVTQRLYCDALGFWRRCSSAGAAGGIGAVAASRGDA